MHKTALDLVPVLRAIEDVQHSPLLTPAQREAICLELHHSLPDPMFCNNGRITLHIIQTILRSKDGSTKPTEVKSPATSKEPKHGARTVVPPPSMPLDGTSDVTLGAGRYVYRATSFRVLAAAASGVKSAPFRDTATVTVVDVA